jgi:hypothetical protein
MDLRRKSDALVADLGILIASMAAFQKRLFRHAVLFPQPALKQTMHEGASAFPWGEKRT